MSQVVTTVSEGYAVDGRMFEPPEVNRDNEKPRYLTFIGSLIEPDTVRSRPWTGFGGIEASNPCLRVVKNFLRKGRITPLLKDTHDFLPFDTVRKTTEVNPLQAGYFGQTIPRNYVPPALPPANGQFQPGFGNLAIGGPSPYGNMVGKLAVPGEQVNAILIGSENMAQNNVPRGIRELKSLLGHDYRQQVLSDGTVDDPTIRAMQLAIFPSYPNLPILLSELHEILDAAAVHTTLREITDEMQESLFEFQGYAESTIQNTHNEMQASAGRRGYVWRYTATDLVLLAQLGIDRKDRQIRQEAAKGNSNERLEGMFEQWLAIQIEEKKANLDRMNRTGEINQDTMAAAPIEHDGYPGQSGYSGFSGEVLSNATPEGQEQIAVAMTDTEQSTGAGNCDACGKYFDSGQGLSLHKRRHCKGAPSNA